MLVCIPWLLIWNSLNGIVDVVLNGSTMLPFFFAIREVHWLGELHSIIWMSCLNVFFFKWILHMDISQWAEKCEQDVESCDGQ